MARPKAERPTYSLTQRGSRFYVTWWEGGSQHRVSTGQTERPKANRFLKQFEAGRGTPLPPDEPTIAEIITGYLADRTPRVASPDTLRYAGAALSRHLGELQPAHLTTERCRAYHLDRRSEGYQAPGARARKPVATGTVIRELVTLRAAFRWAKKAGWIATEPHVEMPPAPPPRERWLTRAEADRLTDECKAAHVYLFVMLGLHTAARAGAILELKWDQVDFAANRINLGRGRGNKRRAIVPINAPLRAALIEAKRGATGNAVIEHGGRPVGSVKTGLAAACRRAKLKIGVTAHTLRHTSASWMVQGGVPLEKVASYLGNTVAMVEKVYGHHAPEWLEEAARALAG